MELSFIVKSAEELKPHKRLQNNCRDFIENSVEAFRHAGSISNRLEKTREKTCRGEPWHGVKILTGVKMPTSQAICEGNRIYSDLHLRAFCSL
ncbi:MAG: hypothetical protein A2W65_03715 [Candidatus Taylorbacteria bacterium RIFCSPLOWO2_02_50_13]|nr:MAG: hypothetical protein A2759_02805 [Candidatus Taylorbacteria bacterium RIFCSPHIGHO2_01_FULL_49_60]OHA37106.1 MAG: hypothetical protein A2W65_03715 [Candidatus Taylorbacteria bacterium RIFCSPLOWO2_02_50_13]